MNIKFHLIAVSIVLLGCFSTQHILAGEKIKPAEPSEHTVKANTNFGKQSFCHWDNKTDFEFAAKGFIAPLDKTTIVNKENQVVWSNVKYDELFKKKTAPHSVNPSLWRHEAISARHGLYKVAEGFYQVRGQDLSNISFIDTPKGYIVIDPLASEETAKAAYEMVVKHVKDKPVIAVIYSHSHIDHFAGVKGVTTDEDVKSGKTKIIAPAGFTHYALEENVTAGNAMSRRAVYMYGSAIPVNEKQQVGAGEGKAVSAGTRTLILPTNEIGKSGGELTVGGEKMKFSFAPGEAPVGMHVYFPARKVLYLADNCVHGIHNLYTIRGALTRNPVAWMQSLDKALEFSDAEITCAGHNWPRFGKNEVKDYISSQRDALKFMHDQTVRLLNHGYTGREIEDMIKLPENLAGRWYLRSYYGDVRHNVRAVYDLYMGWYDANPATLHPLPPRETAAKMLKYMGSSKDILDKAQKDFEAGEYRWVAQVVDYVLWAEPTNEKARKLSAAAQEQLGYQAECSTWRNAYLTAAQELRNGIDNSKRHSSASPDILSAMSVSMFFDYLGIKLNADKAAKKTISVNWVFPDIKEQYAMQLRNSVLDYKSGNDPKAAVTVTLDKATLNAMISGEATVEDLIKTGKLKITGDIDILKSLLAMLDKFEVSFPIASHEPIKTK